MNRSEVNQERWACVDIAELPLQLLLRQHPEWKNSPVVVVAEDKPGALILSANEAARRMGVLPGMRYGAGLSLCAALSAGVVSDDDVAAAIDEVTGALGAFSPGVEPAPEEPGVFWLSADGLVRLFGSLEAWGSLVRHSVGELGFQAQVVVGFTRFGTYALAHSRARGPVWVCVDPVAEKNAAGQVPLDRLGIEPRFREALGRLGVRTVGALVSLPGSGVRRRFGAQAHRLHMLARGESFAPLQPRRIQTPARARRILDDGERDSEGLLFLCKGLLATVLGELSRRHQAATEITVELGQARGETRVEILRPAEPTLDERSLLGLLRLRLSTLRWDDASGGVNDLVVCAQGVDATAEQLRLFAETPKRDPRAADRAFARLRASLGNDAIVHARTTDGHLPEASFEWQPLDAFPVQAALAAALSAPYASFGCAAASTSPASTSPASTSPAERPAPLARRIYTRPRPLGDGGLTRRGAGRPLRADDGWVMNLEQGAVTRLDGPHVVSGGWWAKEVKRDYHLAETQRGGLFWAFYDRVRRGWYLQGQVE